MAVGARVRRFRGCKNENLQHKQHLRELHEHFAQRRPQARTYANPTQPQLLEQRSRPHPFIPLPLAACGKAHLECRMTGEAH